MFRLGIVFVLILGASWSVQAQVKIGNNPTNINNSALLHLENRVGQSRGMIFPYVNLPRTDEPIMGTGGQTAVRGMVVYNTNTSIIGTATYPASGVGIYSFDGTGWVYGGIPSGGSTGQVLSKTTTGLAWGTPASGVMTYFVAGNSAGLGLLVTATGPGVTYSVNPTTQTITFTAPAGVRILSMRLNETQTNTGVSASASILYFNFVTASADNLNTSLTNATIPVIQFFSSFAPPMPIVSRAIRVESFSGNQLRMSVTQMDSYPNYLFLFNF